MKVKKVLSSVLLLALVVTLAGCYGSGGTTSTGTGGTSTGGTAGGGTTVTENNFAFSPATLTVKVGDVVTFQNQDTVAHDVKIDGKELGTQDPGSTMTWTAAKAGSYPYSCTIHPSMTGTIIVQ